MVLVTVTMMVAESFVVYAPLFYDGKKWDWNKYYGRIFNLKPHNSRRTKATHWNCTAHRLNQREQSNNNRKSNNERVTNGFDTVTYEILCARPTEIVPVHQDNNKGNFNVHSWFADGLQFLYRQFLAAQFIRDDDDNDGDGDPIDFCSKDVNRIGHRISSSVARPGSIGIWLVVVEVKGNFPLNVHTSRYCFHIIIWVVVVVAFLNSLASFDEGVSIAICTRPIIHQIWFI